MDIEVLREFVAVGKSLNFTQAAKSLYVDQSTLSRRMQALESELDVTLLVRTTRQVKLTNAGRAFLEDAINLLDRFDASIERARELDVSEKPVIRVGGNLTSGIGVQLINYATAALLKEQLPAAIEIDNSYGSTHQLTKLSNDDPTERLREGSIDLALLYGCEAGDWTGTQHLPLLKDPFVLFVDENHPLSHFERLSIEDIAPYTLRASVFFSRNDTRVTEVCQNHGFTPQHESKIIESEGEWLYSCGKHDAFVFMESNANLVPPQEISGLARIPIDDSDAFYELWAVWRSEDENPGIPIVLDALSTSIAALK